MVLRRDLWGELSRVQDEFNRLLNLRNAKYADRAGSVKFLTTDCRDVLERASARETSVRVAAGALARCFLLGGTAGHGRPLRRSPSGRPRRAPRGIRPGSASNAPARPCAQP